MGAVIARLKPKPLPALQLPEDKVGVLWFWQLGPSRLLQHGNDESGQPGFKSCVLPWHWNQKKFSFLWILITIAQSVCCNDITSHLELRYSSSYVISPTRLYEPCSLLWLSIPFIQGLPHGMYSRDVYWRNLRNKGAFWELNIKNNTTHQLTNQRKIIRLCEL